MPDAAQSASRRAPFVLAALRRRWVTIAVTTIVVLLGTAGYVFEHGRTYASATSVLIRPLNGNAFNSTSLANNQVTTVALQTEANLVASADVTKLVNSRLGTHLAANSGVVTATVPANSQLILITARARTYPIARRYATSFAQAFLDFRAAQAGADQKAQLAQLQSQETTARSDLDAASAVAHQKNPPPEATVNLQLASGQLSQIQNAISQAQSVPLQPGSVVKPAHGVSAGLKQSRPVLLGAGLIGGLILGLLIAAWRELRDDRVRARTGHSFDDLPVLGVLPLLDSAARPGEHTDLVRRARTNLLAGADPGSVVAVAPVSDAEVLGSAGAAVQLGRSLVAAGYRVCLVDAEITAARLGGLLGLPRGAGLADLLAGGPVDSGSDIATHDLASEGGALHVLPAGLDPGASRERYGGAGMIAVLERLRAAHDYVLVVAPPADTGDGLAVARLTDAVALAISDERTTRAQLADARAGLTQLGVAALGVLAVTGGDVPDAAVLTLPATRATTSPSRGTGPTAPSATVTPVTEAEPAEGSTAAEEQEHEPAAGRRS